MHSNTSGFSLAAIIAIVAVIGIAGFIGYRVYETNTKNSTSNQASTQNANQATNQNSNNTPSTTPADTATYLDIKELGVKIKLDDKTLGDTYSYKVSSNGLGDSAVIFNDDMKTIDDAGQYCGGSDAGMIGVLQRSKDAYFFSNGQSEVSVDGKTAFKIGDYYYVFQLPQAECSQNTEIGQKRSAHAQDFIGVLATIQSDK